jgi:hypothetical protein
VYAFFKVEHHLMTLGYFFLATGSSQSGGECLNNKEIHQTGIIICCNLGFFFAQTLKAVGANLRVRPKMGADT